MKKIGFYLRKGGTGKSTTSMMTAHMLSHLGYKVAFVDADTQGTASLGFLGSEPIKNDLASVLEGKCYLDEACLKVRENLYLIPTEFKGSQSSLTKFSESKLVSEYYAFDDLLEELEKMEFDFAIFDLSPSDSLLERRIIKSLDEVIAVTAPAYFETGGLEKYRCFIEEIKKSDRSPVRFGKIVINKINRSISDHHLFMNEIKNIAKNTYEIKQDARIGKMQTLNKTMIDLLESGEIRSEKITEDRSLDGISILVKDIVEGK